MGRNASGVRAITVDSENDEVVGMVVVKEGDGFDVMVVMNKAMKTLSIRGLQIVIEEVKVLKPLPLLENWRTG